MGIPMREGGAVRWAIQWPAGRAGDETRWSVAPDEAGGLAVRDAATDGARATALLAGGIAGRRYRVTARAGGAVRTLDIVAEGW